jgi:hypothetical protein
MRKSLLLSSGNTWKLVAAAGVSPLLLAAADAAGQTFAVSIAVRETQVESGMVGGNGGTHSGTPGVNTSIEWVNLDGLTLVADGTWQQFTFNFGSDPVTFFAGNQPAGGAPNQLDGSWGALEHVRIRNSSGTTNGIRMYIDDMVNTISGTPNTVSGWEATDPIPATLGTEHMFQEPSFSGSTNTSLQPGSSSLVSDAQAHSGTQSDEVIWSWNTTNTASWLRLVTFNTGVQPNPNINFAAGNTLSFWLRAEIEEPDNFWIGPTGGNWFDPANWQTGIVPDGNTAIANLLTATSPITINLDSFVTLNTINFNSPSPNGYTIQGPNLMVLAGLPGFQRTFNVEAGSHTITTAIEVQNGAGNAANGWAVIVNNAADVLTTSGSITLNNLGTMVISKNGAGRWDTSAMLSINDPTLAPVSFQVNGGEMRLLAGGGLTRVNGLGIAGGTTPTAKFNITNNPVVIDYVPTDPPSSPLDTIKAQIGSAFNGGAWDGNGITSSNATSNTHGIGYAEASTLSSVPALFGTVDADAVLMRLTRYGDANLDGNVNLQDFNALAANFGSTDADWVQGDFNYDSMVNLQDFNRLAANFGLVAGPDGPTPEDWAALAAVVPEPGTLSVIGLAALPLMRRRRTR